MTKAPIRVWREPVDETTIAVVAMVEFVYHGGYHQASTFMLYGANAWDWRQKGETRLREFITKDHGGRVPWLCHRSELNPNVFGGI